MQMIFDEEYPKKEIANASPGVYGQERIPEKPERTYDPQLSEKLLECAHSYLRHADDLIYSYGSKTFLSGHDVLETQFGNRGNIDCSTFILLVLAGIPYEESPYVYGHADEETLRPAAWADPELIDFSELPKHYVGIAERIGRPYLKGEKGLDLKKAEEMGISLNMLAEEIKATGITRRSVALAEYFRRKKACFSDPAQARPGDLVFFYSKGFFTDGGRKYQGRQEINHVAIVAEDPARMIQSSGTHKKGGSAESEIPAVSCERILGKRELAFFARY